MELQLVGLVHRQNVMLVTSSRHQYDVIVFSYIFMILLIEEHGKQRMPCSAKFSMTLQTEILSTETSDVLKYFFLKSFNSVL